MRSFLLSKIIVPLHLVAIFGYLAFARITPNNISPLLPLIFFAISLFELSILFPTAKKGEDSMAARNRTWASIKRDPLFLNGILLFLFAVVQTLNGPNRLVFDRTIKSWKYTGGSFSSLPSGLDQLLSIQGAIWALVIFVAITAVRISLGKKGRMFLLKGIISVSSILGIYGLATYAPAPIGENAAPFATFQSNTEAGVFFLMNTLCAFGLLVNEEGREHPSKYSSRFLFATLLINLASTLFTLSEISVAALMIALAVFIGIAIAYFSKVVIHGLKITSLLAVFAVVLVATFLHVVAYPNNRIHTLSAAITSGEWTTEEQKAEKATVNAASMRLFLDHKTKGVGLFGLGAETGIGHYIEDDEWETLTNPDAPRYSGGNDLIQFLGEAGIIGLIILIFPILYLFGVIIRNVILLNKYGTTLKFAARSTVTENEKITFFDIFSPITIGLLISIFTVLTLSFFTPVLHNLLNLLTWSVFLACASKLFPKPAKNLES